MGPDLATGARFIPGVTGTPVTRSWPSMANFGVRGRQRNCAAPRRGQSC